MFIKPPRAFVNSPVALIVAVGLAAPSLAGCSPAPPPAPKSTVTVTAAPTGTDTGRETEACQLMDDPIGQDLGYTPAQYAFMLLRAAPVGDSMETPTSDVDAMRVMVAATRDHCTRHTADLPQKWLATPPPPSRGPTVAAGALNLATAMGHIKEGLKRLDLGEPATQWPTWIEIVKEYLKAGDRRNAVDSLQGFTGSERTAVTLVDCISQGIVATPPQVQAAIDAL